MDSLQTMREVKQMSPLVTKLGHLQPLLGLLYQAAAEHVGGRKLG